MRPGAGQMAPASQIARVSDWLAGGVPAKIGQGIKQRPAQLHPARLHGAQLLMTVSVGRYSYCALPWNSIMPTDHEHGFTEPMY